MYVIHIFASTIAPLRKDLMWHVPDVVVNGVVTLTRCSSTDTRLVDYEDLMQQYSPVVNDRVCSWFLDTNLRENMTPPPMPNLQIGVRVSMLPCLSNKALPDWIVVYIGTDGIMLSNITNPSTQFILSADKLNQNFVPHDGLAYVNWNDSEISVAQ